MWPSPGARLRLAAESAAFFTGDVPTLEDTPPDYGDDDDESIRAALADCGLAVRTRSRRRSSAEAEIPSG